MSVNQKIPNDFLSSTHCEKNMALKNEENLEEKTRFRLTVSSNSRDSQNYGVCHQGNLFRRFGESHFLTWDGVVQLWLMSKDPPAP